MSYQWNKSERQPTNTLQHKGVEPLCRNGEGSLLEVQNCSQHYCGRIRVCWKTNFKMKLSVMISKVWYIYIWTLNQKWELNICYSMGLQNDLKHLKGSITFIRLCWLLSFRFKGRPSLLIDCSIVMRDWSLRQSSCPAAAAIKG